MIDQRAPQPAINPWPVRHLYYSVAGLRLFRGARPTADTLPLDRQSAWARITWISGSGDRCAVWVSPSAREIRRARQGGPALGGESRTAGTQLYDATTPHGELP